MKKFKSREERFLSYVLKTDSCWIWNGLRFPSQYGRFAGEYAHRFAYKAFKGQIKEGLCVCHSCDNPSCVNPEHLWLGTMADNMKDRDLKGRGKPKSLSERQIIEIKKMYKWRSKNNNSNVLAGRYGVNANTILRVVKK